MSGLRRFATLAALDLSFEFLVDLNDVLDLIGPDWELAAPLGRVDAALRWQEAQAIDRLRSAERMVDETRVDAGVEHGTCDRDCLLDKHVYGPWALVTGASSGIGEEFARQAAANGINVVLLARRAERLKEIAAELTARYDVQARVVAVDLGRDGILDPVAEATDDLGIGLVVSNAGAGNPGPFISLPRERLREIVQLNVITHLDLAHHFGQRLAKRGRGGIVLVSAVAAAGGLPYMANDSATKAYPLNLGEALHVELRQAGVHVTVLVPVLVNTPVVARIGLDKLGLPAELISPEQAVDEALTALLANHVTTLTRTHMTAAFEDMKGAVAEMIQARLAAAQPAH